MHVVIQAIVLLMGSLTFGYTMAYPSPALPEFRKKWPDVSEIELTLFNAAPSLLAIGGPAIVNLILKHMGRRPCISIVAAYCAICWFLFTPLNGNIFPYGIVIRALCGFAIGGFSSIVPLYLIEIVPENQKGIYGSLSQMSISIGSCIAYLVGEGVNWRWMAIIAGIENVMMCGLVWLFPESPVVTKKDGNEEKNITTESALQKKYMRVLVMGILLMFFQQFSGCNAILTNLNSLFEDAGVDIKPGFAAAIASCSQIIACFVGGIVMDKFGRKIMWIASSFGMVFSLLLYAIKLKVESITPWLAIIAIAIYWFMFGIGTGPIPWFIINERVSDSVRASASSIVSASNWVLAFLMIVIFPFLKDGITEFGCFILFMIVCTLSGFYGIFFIHNANNIEEKEGKNCAGLCDNSSSMQDDIILI